MICEKKHYNLLFIGLLALAMANLLNSSGQALEGCPKTCSDYEIHYPFGIRDGCYHDPEFLITCNMTFTPPKMFLMDSNIEVTNISLQEGELTILNGLAYDCYKADGSPESDYYTWIRFVKFKVSNRRNKFTVVGCDTYAFIDGEQGGDFYRSGCTASCSSINNVINGSCTGVGCCQTSLPTGVDYYDINVKSYHNHTRVWNHSQCGYAFVVQENKFSFTLANLSNLSDVDKLPVVLDWAIGNETCNSTANICGNHSKCVDSINGSGYRCNCSDGYQGNPYLPNGCQDIDECKDSSLNNCEKVCTNTAGDYTCSCPKGYLGDGIRGGQGCIRIVDQSLPIKIVVGACTGIGAMLFLIGGWWLSKLVKRRKETKQKDKFYKRNGGLLLEQQISSDKGNFEASKLFTSKELVKATDNYNLNRVLGQGGQGTVYKGMLTDGRIVAVKKSKMVDEGQLGQFINEVIILSQINHRSIVKLLGFCLETEVPMLVYEYVPNGTLFQYIHNQIEEFPLTWELRLRIAAQVAGALSYLHYAASVPIYHRDIKSTNILLDEKFRAKVADFGTSRSVCVDQTHLTTVVQGTFGYLDPEYIQSSQFTEKSDVYSFGVVLVELLTGKKALSSIASGEGKSLAAYFIFKMEENQVLDIIDSRVAKEGKEKEISVVTNLAMRCLNLYGKQRPTMREILVELESITLHKTESSTLCNYEEIEYPTVEVNGEPESDSTSLRSLYSFPRD